MLPESEVQTRANLIVRAVTCTLNDCNHKIYYDFISKIHVYVILTSFYKMVTMILTPSSR